MKYRVVNDLTPFEFHDSVWKLETFEAGALALEKIHSGTDRLTEKNYRETLANWHDFVVNYDYDKFWDDYYWYQFHTPAGAKT